MEPRQDITLIFSKFLEFSDDCVHSWIVDPRLRRSMERHLEQSSDASRSKHFWALYWYKHWQDSSNPGAKSHLLAYLQEAAYWAAYKMSKMLTSQRHQLSDCFQVALLATDGILKRFNPHRGTNLEGYALVAFRGAIADFLKQQQEIAMCTVWALLYNKLSTKRFRDSLANYGFTPEEIAQYELAWMCFKMLYVPTKIKGKRAFRSPPLETWKAIARLYNAERNRQLISPGRKYSAATMKDWLATIVEAVRAFCNPQIQAGGEWIDDWPDLDRASLLDVMAQVEEAQRQYAQINAILVQAIDKLEPLTQQILQLYYSSEDRKQEQVAQILGITQPKVARRSIKARKTLLKALLQWSGKELDPPLDSDRAKERSEALSEWLRKYYRPQ